MVGVASLVEAELGSRAELHCQAAGVPLPNPMEWSFKGKFISSLEGFSGRLDWFDST